VGEYARQEVTHTADGSIHFGGLIVGMLDWHYVYRREMDHFCRSRYSPVVDVGL
jgi:hypothetical protein